MYTCAHIHKGQSKELSLKGRLLLARAWKKRLLNGIMSSLITYQLSDQKFITQPIYRSARPGLQD